MKPTRVAIADDHSLIVEAVRLALQDVEDIEVVGAAASGRELLNLVRRITPDVVLLDLRMPGMDGLTCLDQLRAQDPRIKVVILSALDDPDLIAESLRRGASAYVVKTVDPRDLVSVIRTAMEGTVFTRQRPAALRTGKPSELDRLTAKEQAVLGALARGLSNRQIADELSLSDQTVKFHLTNIYRKLAITNRADAARFGYEHGLTAPHATEPS